MAMSTAVAKPGQTTWWPATVPTFTPIALPPVLRLAIDSAAAAPPEGQMVAAGEAISPAAAARTAVVAPCRARVGQVTRIESSGVVLARIELVPALDGDASVPGAAVANASDESFRGASTADFGPWIDRLGNAGVNAARIASPDLIGQLNMALRRPVDTVICGALDSDPTMRVQGALCATYPEDLEAGLTLLAKCCGASRVCVVIEAWSPAAWTAPLRKVLRGGPIKPVELANDYPQSDPSLMLYTITRRRLRPGRLPVERATLLLDAAAAIGVGRAARGRPALPVHMAVRDRSAGMSHYLTTMDGTPLDHILAALPVSRPHILRGGDLLRDRRLARDAAMAVAGERIIHVCPPEAIVNPEPCIRCAWCMESCPTRVHPAMLLEAAQENDLARARWAGLDACIECGICVHVCASQLPILDGIRQLKRRGQPAAIQQDRGSGSKVSGDPPGQA